MDCGKSISTSFKSHGGPLGGSSAVSSLCRWRAKQWLSLRSFGNDFGSVTLTLPYKVVLKKGRGGESFVCHLETLAGKECVCVWGGISIFSGPPNPVLLFLLPISIIPGSQSSEHFGSENQNKNLSRLYLTKL